MFLDHYFCVQDNSNYHGKDSSGAVDRTNFPIILQNVRCNVQEVNKQDAVLKYNIKVSEKLYVLYHRQELTLDETIRIIIPADNLFKEIQFPLQQNDILILEYRGRRRPTFSRNRRWDAYELYGEHNKRWQI